MQATTTPAGPIVPQAPTFDFATLRTVLAEMTAEHPERAWRLVRAANLVAVRDITAYHGIGHLVGSECDPTRAYWVQPIDGRMTCDCQDYRQRGGPCKHGLAVELLQRCERAQAEAEDPTTAPIGYALTPKALAVLAAPELDPVA
jgi:hypothetical protein